MQKLRVIYRRVEQNLDDSRLANFYLALHKGDVAGHLDILRRAYLRVFSFPTYVAEVVGAAQGYVSFLPSPGEIEVTDLFVNPLFRGLGIGRGL